MIHSRTPAVLHALGDASAISRCGVRVPMAQNAHPDDHRSVTCKGCVYQMLVTYRRAAALAEKYDRPDQAQDFHQRAQRAHERYEELSR